MIPLDVWAAHMLSPEPPPLAIGDSVTDVALRLTTDERLRALLVHRQHQGIARYGTELRSHNGRDVRHDLCQELVDALLYATQLRIETGEDGLRRQIEALLSLALTQWGEP